MLRKIFTLHRRDVVRPPATAHAPIGTMLSSDRQLLGYTSRGALLLSDVCVCNIINEMDLSFHSYSHLHK